MRGIEKQISKFLLFVYFFISGILLISISFNENEKIEKDYLKFFQNFLGILNEYSKIKFDNGNNFKKINKLIE